MVSTHASEPGLEADLALVGLSGQHASAGYDMIAAIMALSVMLVLARQNSPHVLL